MPKQEVFFVQELGGRRVEVLKTYDSVYARDAFDNMGEAAHDALSEALEIGANYDSEDIPKLRSVEYLDFLWEAMKEAAREDGNLLSFFVVNEASGNVSESLYVSPDWPSAERFARGHLQAPPGHSLFTPIPA